MMAELKLVTEGEPPNVEVLAEASIEQLVVALIELTSVLTSHEDQKEKIGAALTLNEEWAIAIVPLVKEPSLRTLSVLLLGFLKKTKQGEILHG